MLKELSRIVKDAGALTLTLKAEKYFSGTWVGSQFKADADIKIHDFFTQKLNNLSPNTPIVSEEDVKSHSIKDEPHFIIDPIDGTASFINSFPGYVNQISYIENNQVLVSAVYAPELDQLYSAERTKGATLNGEKLRVNQHDDIKTIIDNYPEKRGITESIANAFSIKNYIESGSIGLKICKVACGSADIFVKDMLPRDWDLAPPLLILQEAGGVLTDIKGRDIQIGRGNRKHNGLIATASREKVQSLVNWLRQSESNLRM